MDEHDAIIEAIAGGESEAAEHAAEGDLAKRRRATGTACRSRGTNRHIRCRRPGQHARIGDKAIAERRNQQFKVVNGVALLIDKDTGEVVRRRLLHG